MKTWYIIETGAEYEEALNRYEKVRKAAKGSVEHKEKRLLAFLINHFEEKQMTLPELDPIELIKTRMEDFGYKATNLSKEYGDKGTVSKVLNYKQPLSLNMIRKFSKLLRIPTENLLKEYQLVKK